MTLLRPKPLKSGDRIGIVSPSSPAGRYPRRLERAIRCIADLGYEPVLARHCLEDIGHIAGSPKNRAQDINDMFADDSISAIFSTTGGLNANQLVELLDYQTIAAHPKIFMGYSDISVLLMAIWAATGLATVHGPCLLTQFGEVGGLHDYTMSSFVDTLVRPTELRRITPSLQRIEERLWWDEQDDRPRQVLPDRGPRVFREGSASGPLIAGNMGAMLTLSGTRRWPDMSGHILFLEEDETETAGTIERMLTHYAQIGALENAAGLAFGRFHPQVNLSGEQFDQILERCAIPAGIPVITDLDFSHVDPMFLLPWGAQAHLVATDAVDLSVGNAMEMAG